MEVTIISMIRSVPIRQPDSFHNITVYLRKCVFVYKYTSTLIKNFNDGILQTDDLQFCNKEYKVLQYNLNLLFCMKTSLWSKLY